MSLLGSAEGPVAVFRCVHSSRGKEPSPFRSSWPVHETRGNQILFRSAAPGPNDSRLLPPRKKGVQDLPPRPHSPRRSLE